MEINKKELKKILIIALVAAFAFTFNDWGIDVFDFFFGFTNLILAFIFTLTIYLVHITTQKLTANYFDHNIEFEILSMTKKIKEIRKTIQIPIGPIITLLITLISNGKLFFLLLNSFKDIPNKTSRVGRQWTNIKDFEEAQIALAGPLSSLILLALFKILSPLSLVFNQGMFIASTIAIFNMLPLPKVDGVKIFMGSRILYIASLIFIILFILLAFNLSIIQTLILSLILSLATGLIYLYRLKS
jgi:Zn-dependent protease